MKTETRLISPAVLLPMVAAWLMATSAAAEPARGLPRFEPADRCAVNPPADLELGFKIDCGQVVVPEFHRDPGSRELSLGVTRLSSGRGTAATPLFMLNGGPGQTAISPEFFLLFHQQLLGPIVEARDVVIVEQRGTEYTEPYLDCPAALAAPWAANQQGLTKEQATAAETRILRECIDGFKAQGVNFDAFNSVENAADVNAVREALGYQKIIYYGASYGSQLGQHFMRDFPGALEAIVLDGAESLSRKSWVENRALDAQWGIENLARRCQAEEGCRTHFDIPALVDAALALFEQGPVPYTHVDAADPAIRVAVEVTMEDMVGLIYELQNDRYGAVSLPLTLSQMVTAGPEQAAQLLGEIKASKLIASRNATNSPMALLMHIAMVCSDDPVHSVDDVITAGVGRYAAMFGQAGAVQYAALCALINVAELPDTTDAAVTTEVPVLLLSGDLDAATPTFRSQLVADALPNATLVVFPGRTHVQIAGVNRCAAVVMKQFVLESGSRLDTSCTQEEPQLGFILPENGSSPN